VWQSGGETPLADGCRLGAEAKVSTRHETEVSTAGVATREKGSERTSGYA
jgi:hypothetical protein